MHCIFPILLQPCLEICLYLFVVFSLGIMAEGAKTLDSTAPRRRAPPTAEEKPELRRVITADGSSGFIAETDRYHLYVTMACPFSHRALLGRKLKGLDHVITVDILDPIKAGSDGWIFNSAKPGCTADTVNGKSTLLDVYRLVDPNFVGRASVPLLWDKKKGTSVNNESAEILRMLSTEFNALSQTEAQRDLDLYPPELREKIDAINVWLSPDINVGVYKCGFATTQEDYDKAVDVLYAALDRVETLLAENRFLAGNQITEVDVKLFASLIRFDTVYATLFRYDRKRIVDYPNMWPYLRDLYQTPGFGDTVNMEHIRKGYFQSMKQNNPTGIVSTGPVLDYNATHGRDKKFAK